MRFAEKGYYIEQYVKCANCGMLIYAEGIQGSFEGKPAIFCSAWCRGYLGSSSHAKPGIHQPRIVQ